LTVPRDRDEAGRPRSARPRDESGRPLARDALGVPTVDEDAATRPTDALAAAQRALDDGHPFAAHEYLESAWRLAEPPERDLWQGLAQLAVALTHLQRNNKTGARALFERSRERLTAYAGTSPYDIDVDGVRDVAGRMAAALTAGDETDVGAIRLLRTA
jgi:hypothetical protein